MAERIRTKDDGELVARSAGLYAAPGSLTEADEDRLVRSMVAEIESEWRAACGAIIRIGQLLVDACYGGNAREALEDARGRNRRFAVVAQKVDALGIGLGAERLSVARRIVAWNHVIRSPYWDRLDDGHKEILLALGERQELIDGARWAIQCQASTRRLEVWVRERRKALGEEIVSRGVRWSSVSRSLGQIEKAGSQTSLERIGREFGKLAPAEQRAAREQVRRIKSVLDRLEKRLNDS